MLESKGQ